ncbi:acyltransferase family protein [Duganella phyllosphaerae]|uniref:O-acetyltransferase OatA n=1 Tax=Duganella phyllosphaerae TaxID=762836 RepID=A0A1E7X1J3_9BURK|nr:acyltransferase family protein [Duganella phyllosphaerae]OFA05949.1 O-acetyltransferase OatA [Duganella phyllosphaerae]
MSKTSIQTDISGLRALSVVIVVLYHFNLKILSGGFIGVDIFFVISGFLMSRIIVDAMGAGRFHYGQFLLRRALRIVPALLAMSLVLLALGAALLPPSDLASMGTQALRALLFVSNYYYAGQQGYFSEGVDDRWLLHTWSLSVEWQFYMLYPAIVWLGLRITQAVGATPRALTFYLLAIAIASLALCLLVDHQSAFFSVLTRAWQMIAGGLVYLMRDSVALRALQKQGRARILSYAGLLVIGLTAGLIHHWQLEATWPGPYALLPVAGACMVLAAGYQRNMLLNHGVMQKLGAWSYSIYLWHWPVVIAFTMIGLMDEAPKLAKLIGIPLSIALGYLSYRYVEPMRPLRAVPPLRAALAMGAASVTLCGLAVTYSGTKGLEMRTHDPELYRAIAAATGLHTYASECENSGATRDRFCHLNPNQPGDKILVLGDSHAGHLYPWFVQHSRRDTTFYVKSGCPVIPGFERIGLDNHCREYTEQAFRLAASGTYQTVIVSQNWSFFSPQATGICSMEGGRCVTPRASPHPMLPVERTREALQRLLAAGVRVVVVDATPWFAFNVPKYVERSLFWRDTIDARVASPNLIADNVEFDRLFADLSRQPGFSLVSLRNELCQASQCTIFDARQRIPVFVDKSHLNPRWIERNGQQFQRFAGAPGIQTAPASK